MAKKTFEENMARLEEIVALLEKGDAQLSQSLSLPHGAGQGRAAGGAADEGSRRRAH